MCIIDNIADRNRLMFMKQISRKLLVYHQAVMQVEPECQAKDHDIMNHNRLEENQASPAVVSTSTVRWCLN
ncbi:hypothetical protein KIN20_009901 [Parelaphostrongylus tenuis]|uniref:Uncharacterized protein n=1 Tax=Parelaphostrongylus tenuis TaxID=148309 RepID=A0AAD5M8U0_PARTN|nr:hypothetical protein KIN20_009901 [Parelaphostrongylus tenuis]